MFYLGTCDGFMLNLSVIIQNGLKTIKWHSACYDTLWTFSIKTYHIPCHMIITLYIIRLKVYIDLAIHLVCIKKFVELTSFIAFDRFQWNLVCMFSSKCKCSWHSFHTAQVQSAEVYAFEHIGIVLFDIWLPSVIALVLLDIIVLL